MRLPITLRRVVALVACLLLLGPMAAAADGPAVERPLYLDIVGTEGSQAVLPDDLVEAMAREVLSQSGQAVLSVGDDSLPAGVRVLRIMVLISQSHDPTGTVIAAAATTSLLRTPADGSGETAARAVYQGMQQEMATGPNQASAEKALRDRFKAKLGQRIRAALSAGR